MQKHVRVITPIRSPTFRSPSHFAAFQRPDLRVDYRLVPDGPDSIESRLEEALCVVPTIAAIVRAQDEGAQAVVVDCMGDPAVEAAREVVTIPVVGPGRLAVHMAATLGSRFGILSVLDRLSPLFVEIVEHCGQSARYVGSSSVDVPVLELEDVDPQSLHTALADCATQLVARGADVIIFGCTGMLGCTQGVRKLLLARRLDVPVIDPVPLAIQVAAGLIDVGLSHSKHCYPAPKRPSPSPAEPDGQCA